MRVARKRKMGGESVLACFSVGSLLFSGENLRGGCCKIRTKVKARHREKKGGGGEGNQ